jgi:hypothetical protein
LLGVLVLRSLLGPPYMLVYQRNHDELSHSSNCVLHSGIHLSFIPSAVNGRDRLNADSCRQIPAGDAEK